MGVKSGSWIITFINSNQISFHCGKSYLPSFGLFHLPWTEATKWEDRNTRRGVNKHLEGHSTRILKQISHWWKKFWILFIAYLLWDIFLLLLIFPSPLLDICTPPVNSNDKLNVGTAVLYLTDNVSNCKGRAEIILFFYFFFQSSSTGFVTRKKYNSSQLCRKFLWIGQLTRHSLQRGGFLID